MVPLTLLLFLNSAAGAVEISFRFNPHFSADNYLTYFLAQIPLNQFEADQVSQTIRIRGPLVLDLSQLPEKTAERFLPRLRRVLDGEILISGARLDSSRAEIAYKTSLPSAPAPRATQSISKSEAMARMFDFLEGNEGDDEDSSDCERRLTST